MKRGGEQMTLLPPVWPGAVPRQHFFAIV